MYDREKLETHTPVWVKWFGSMQNFVTEQQAKTKEFPLEYRLDLQGNSEIVFSDRTETHKFDFNHTIFYVRTTPGRICFHDYLFTTVLSSQ